MPLGGGSCSRGCHRQRLISLLFPATAKGLSLLGHLEFIEELAALARVETAHPAPAAAHCLPEAGDEGDGLKCWRGSSPGTSQVWFCSLQQRSGQTEAYQQFYRVFGEAEPDY